MELPPPNPETLDRLGRLKSIVDALRSPGGCPWDLEQTPESLKPFLLEEAHEVAEAIDHGDPGELRDELGDLLMNIFLQARIGEEESRYSLGDVADRISEKLIRRHPHVFGDVDASDSDAVRRNWEAIKREEKAEKGEEIAPPSAIRPLPASLPALARGVRIGSMAAEVGFDWPDPSGPLEKVAEELEEVREAASEGDPEALEAEVGDLLFAITSLCRHHDLEPERALRGATERFSRRFQRLEGELETSSDRSLERLDALWAKAKGAELPQRGRGDASDDR